MGNHYHLVVETPDANLVAGMAWLQSTYTIRFNHRHKLFGHVLSVRYKAQMVEGSGDGYLRTAHDLRAPTRDCTDGCGKLRPKRNSERNKRTILWVDPFK